MRKKHIPVKKLYFLMNKAAGTVCSTVSDRRRTVYEAFPDAVLADGNGARLHSVGRLDADTEGLLLFTNDGKLSNFLTRPESKIEKTYLVVLASPVCTSEQKNYSEKATAGLVLPAEKKAGEQKSGVAKILWRSETECEISLCEGKFHEVKRIFRALGNEVKNLKRIKFAGLALPADLGEGDFRELTAEETEFLVGLQMTNCEKVFERESSF